MAEPQTLLADRYRARPVRSAGAAWASSGRPGTRARAPRRGQAAASQVGLPRRRPSSRSAGRCARHASPPGSTIPTPCRLRRGRARGSAVPGHAVRALGAALDRVREGGPLDVRETAAIGAQVASALAAAHQLGIVHRDVKPGNVLLADEGTAMISDFGISRRARRRTFTSTGLVHGTLAYLAPRSRAVQARAPPRTSSPSARRSTPPRGRASFGTDSNAIACCTRWRRESSPCRSTPARSSPSAGDAPGRPRPTHGGRVREALGRRDGRGRRRVAWGPEPRRRSRCRSRSPRGRVRRSGPPRYAAPVGYRRRSTCRGGRDEAHDRATARATDLAARRSRDHVVGWSTPGAARGTRPARRRARGGGHRRRGGAARGTRPRGGRRSRDLAAARPVGLVGLVRLTRSGHRVVRLEQPGALAVPVRDLRVAQRDANLGHADLGHADRRRARGRRHPLLRTGPRRRRWGLAAADGPLPAHDLRGPRVVRALLGPGRPAVPPSARSTPGRPRGWTRQSATAASSGTAHGTHAACRLVGDDGIVKIDAALRAALGRRGRSSSSSRDPQPRPASTYAWPSSSLICWP